MSFFHPYVPPVYFQPVTQIQEEARTVSYGEFQAEKASWLKQFDQLNVRIQELMDEKKNAILNEVSYGEFQAEKASWLKQVDQLNVRIQELMDEKKNAIPNEVVSMLKAEVEQKTNIIESNNNNIIKLNKEIGIFEGRVIESESSKKELLKLSREYGKIQCDFDRVASVNAAALIRSTLELFKKKILCSKHSRRRYLHLQKGEVETAAAIERAYNLFLFDDTNPLSVQVQQELVREGIDAQKFINMCLSSYNLTSKVLHHCVNTYKNSYNLNQYIKDIEAVPQLTREQIKCIEIIASVIPA